MDKLDFIEIIKEILIREVDPFLIYTFGSAAKEELRDESDIDIAYLSNKKIDDYERFRITQILAEKLKREVDLVDMASASTVFKTQIIHTGKVIFCTSDSKRMNFEMVAFKEYALLNEERDEILKGIKERGSVYG